MTTISKLLSSVEKQIAVVYDPGTPVMRDLAETQRLAARTAVLDRAPVLPVQAQDDDLLEVTRTVCAMAAHMRDMDDARRKHFPSPLSECSPLLEAAQAACVKRGYTEDGLWTDVVAAHPTAGQQAAGSVELIDLLKAIRPKFGAVGSRDVDVAAQQKYIDRAIELLDSRAQPVAANTSAVQPVAWAVESNTGAGIRMVTKITLLESEADRYANRVDMAAIGCERKKRPLVFRDSAQPVAAGELPPLPEPEPRYTAGDFEAWAPVYTDREMERYARAYGQQCADSRLPATSTDKLAQIDLDDDIIILQKANEFLSLPAEQGVWSGDIDGIIRFAQFFKAYGRAASVDVATVQPVAAAVPDDVAKDAARYRWLCHVADVTQLPALVERVISPGGGTYVADGKASIDEAIDATLAAAPTTGEG